MDFMPKKKLGFGLMRLPVTDPTDPTKVDLEQLKKMVDLFLEKGFTYFDTAWMYNDFASEKAAKEALNPHAQHHFFDVVRQLVDGVNILQVSVKFHHASDLIAGAHLGHNQLLVYFVRSLAMNALAAAA